MQTPIPEPYDITEIPYIAWVPGLSAWGCALLGITLLALYVWRRNTPRPIRGDIKIIDKMLTELRQALEGSGGLNIERTSRIVRRIISHISNRNVAELTADELRASIQETTPPRLAAITRSVASFEEVGYSPPSPERDASARALAKELTSLITDYRDELRGR